MIDDGVDFVPRGQIGQVGPAQKFSIATGLDYSWDQIKDCPRSSEQKRTALVCITLTDVAKILIDSGTRMKESSVLYCIVFLKKDRKMRRVKILLKNLNV